MTPQDRQVRFPPELPISSRVVDIARAIDAHPVVIVAGETGSGKTTQLPKIALAMGRGLEAHIGVTQPRRLAATSLSARVAAELGVELGQEVGYQIRFANKTSRGTYVKFMTDGILLAETQGDPKLRAYDTLILDEVHERSLNIDFLLGYVKRLLPQRPDLRVVVSSATLDTARLSAFFGGAPVIQVSGRMFPVEVIHRPPEGEEAPLAEAVAAAIEEITALDPREDILVFLPGEREIHDVMDELATHGLPHSVLLPLYGRLSQAEQGRVFQTLPQRRIVLATNVAETSVTIPGIVYVVDTGLARVNRDNPRSGVTQLQIEPISRASADQRKGRAGRVRAGVCFRLYTAQDEALRPAYTDPEIQRVGLAGAILQMKALGLGEIEAFPFLDPPSKRAIDEGYRVLEELSALDADREVTELGRKLARLPVDPRVGRMILAGEGEGALREVLVIAAALGAQDPRERPLAAQARADEKHRAFREESSDFLGLLKLWRFYQDAQGRLTRGQLERTCRDNFLSPMRLREWGQAHQQLAQLARELGFRTNEAPAKDEAIHRAVLAGLLSRLGLWHPEQKVYLGARQTRFALHPSSALARKPPAWVVVAELVETSRLFGRTAARIDPLWLESVAGPLCRRSHGEPHWEQRAAQGMVKEQVTLYGLPIVRDRKVSYGAIDPAGARRLFILHALVRQEYAERPPFVEHNAAVFEQARRLRDRARRSDLLADEDALALFFEKRVPDEVHSGKTFEAFRAVAEARDPHLLELSLADVLADEAQELRPERFPDALELRGVTLPLAYRFEPGEADDGISVTVPLLLLASLELGVLEWTIPAWQVEKLDRLLHGLPKALRKALGSVGELVPLLAAHVRPFEGPMLPALAAAIHALTGVRVPAEAWDLDDLPPYLRLHVRVVDADGRLAGASRDLADLESRLGGRAREAWAHAVRPAWELRGLTGWSFGALAESVVVEHQGHSLLAYPALVETETTVALRALPSRAGAEQATRVGLRRLYLFQAGTSAALLEQQLPASLSLGSLADALDTRVPGLRKQLATRALEEAFSLADAASFPRSRRAFDERLADGRGRLPSVLAQLGRLASDIGAEHERARATLRSLSGSPGAPGVALDDIRSQLGHLLPATLFARASLDRLAHLPRYLRAIQVRLGRLPNGPQKDREKALQVLPFWNDFLKHREGLRARGVPAEELEAFRWLVEELRVSVFAPEVKAALPVSAQRLTEQWKALSGA